LEGEKTPAANQDSRRNGTGEVQLLQLFPGSDLRGEREYGEIGFVEEIGRYQGKYFERAH